MSSHFLCRAVIVLLVLLTTASLIGSLITTRKLREAEAKLIAADRETRAKLAMTASVFSLKRLAKARADKERQFGRYDFGLSNNRTVIFDRITGLRLELPHEQHP